MACPATAHCLARPAPGLPLCLLLCLLLLGGARPCGAAPDAPSPLPGKQLRLALGPRTSVVYEPRPLPPRQPLAVQPGDAAPSVGLEFQAPPGHASGPRSLLRVQLSADAAVQFRPRRGGLAVSYRAEF